MGRGRDFRGGGKGRDYHADESDAPAAPSDRPSPRPSRRQLLTFVAVVRGLSEATCNLA
jgi:hypothetical protein